MKNAPDPLYRIDGSWYVCFDRLLAPTTSECNVLSFGVNLDYTFDKAMNENFGCNVHSFDPVVEDKLFADIRKSNPSLAQSAVIEVNKKWTFYKFEIFYMGNLFR